jgi:hypothetical protein
MSYFKKNVVIIMVLLFAGLTMQSCSDKNEITVNQVPMKWQYDVPATNLSFV